MANRKWITEEKELIGKRYPEDNNSIAQLVKEEDVSSDRLVREWDHKFLAKGIEGLGINGQGTHRLIAYQQEFSLAFFTLE